MESAYCANVVARRKKAGKYDCFSVSFGVFSRVDSVVRLSGQESSLGANNGILDGCNGVLVFEGVRIVRLIDADALKRELKVCGIIDHYGTQVLIKIDNMPTIDAEPVVHGRWIYCKRGRAECSECHRDFVDVYDLDNADNYCRHCGAKMAGEAQDG